MVDMKTPKGHFENNWPLNRTYVECQFIKSLHEIAIKYWKSFQLLEIMFLVFHDTIDLPCLLFFARNSNFPTLARTQPESFVWKIGSGKEFLRQNSTRFVVASVFLRSSDIVLERDEFTGFFDDFLSCWKGLEIE